MRVPAAIARDLDELRLMQVTLGHPHLVAEVIRLELPVIRTSRILTLVFAEVVDLARGGELPTLAALRERFHWFPGLPALLAKQARLGYRIADPEAELRRLLVALAGSPGGAR